MLKEDFTNPCLEDNISRTLERIESKQPCVTTLLRSDMFTMHSFAIKYKFVRRTVFYIRKKSSAEQA